MKQYYHYSRHPSFREACDAAKSLGAAKKRYAVVRRSKTKPQHWDVFVRYEITQVEDKEWEKIPDDPYSGHDDAYDDVLREAEYEDEIWMEEQMWAAGLEHREILQDIESDRDDWGRIDDDGWFYED